MFAMIDTQLSPWTVVLICLRTCALWLGPKARASAYDRSKVPLYKCPYPDSPDLGQHEKFLEGLNGTRIVLLGDSTTRFQYMTLASFLAKGVCPGTENTARSEEYNDLYLLREIGDELYREGLGALNTALTVETCVCEAEQDMPGYRMFTYKDGQDQVIEVIFMHYDTEATRPLKSFIQTAVRSQTVRVHLRIHVLHKHLVVAITPRHHRCKTHYIQSQPGPLGSPPNASKHGTYHRTKTSFNCYNWSVSFVFRGTAVAKENLRPTHMVLNYGQAMAVYKRDCGYKAPFSHCPDVAEVCEFLNGEHEYQVLWQTTTPRVDRGDTLMDTHMHIPHACSMDPRKVLHRGLVVSALEPNVTERGDLYLDIVNFSPLANHAFNGLLLEKIMSGKSEERL